MVQSSNGASAAEFSRAILGAYHGLLPPTRYIAYCYKSITCALNCMFDSSLITTYTSSAISKTTLASTANILYWCSFLASQSAKLKRVVNMLYINSVLIKDLATKFMGCSSLSGPSWVRATKYMLP